MGWVSKYYVSMDLNSVVEWDEWASVDMTCTWMGDHGEAWLDRIKVG